MSDLNKICLVFLVLLLHFFKKRKGFAQFSPNTYFTKRPAAAAAAAAAASAAAAAAAAKSLQLCPTLCNPIDDLLPGSPIPGILQARTLEWATISFSNA